MKLIEFPEQTVKIAEHQPEYLTLPAYQYEGDPQGTIVCCWQLTWRERIALLFSGLLWHRILTFGKPLQPIMLTVEKPEMPPHYGFDQADADTVSLLSKGGVYDGDLPSKESRDKLVKAGLAYRWEGWNFLTELGIESAKRMGLEVNEAAQRPDTEPPAQD